MFAIAFDLVVAETARRHPKGVSQAYADIGARLGEFGFDRVQGSLYISDSEDLANLFAAIMALKALPWLPSFGARHQSFSRRTMVRLHQAGQKLSPGEI